MNLTRALGSVGGTRTFRHQVLGLARDMLFAQFVGAELRIDAFAVAWRYRSCLRRCSPRARFRRPGPMFNRKDRGPEGARSRRRHRFRGRRALGAAAVAASDDDAPRAVRVAGDLPDLAGLPRAPLHEQFAFAVMLTALRLPLFLMLISLSLAARQHPQFAARFSVSRSSTILLNLAQIVALVFFHAREPLADARRSRSRSAAHCSSRGCCRPCWASHVRLKVERPTINKDVKRLLKLIAPAAAGAGAVQFDLLVSTALATGLLPHGSVFVVYYADRLNQFARLDRYRAPSAVLSPTISRQLGRSTDAEAMTTQNRCLELALFFTLPQTVALVICGVPIITGLLQHRPVRRERRVEDGSGPRRIFDWPSVLYSGEGPCGPGCYTTGTAKTPMRYAMISQFAISIWP